MESKIIDKVAAFIVDKRFGFYLIYTVLAIFFAIASGWVSVNNDITDYLSKDTETRQGIDVMDREFITYGRAEVMVDNITYSKARKIESELENIKGVKEVDFDDTSKHYADSSALYFITFDKPESNIACEKALKRVEKHLKPYDTYVSAELGNTKAERIAEEMKLIMLIAVIIIVSVLLFTSQTYMEVPVQLMTFGTAAILNKGSNFLLGEISFVSNSIAVILQLALAIDYAIILCHRYTEERESKEAREAVITALGKAIPEISGSCLTTLSGLAAMGFMHFKLGLDMSIVLIKAIIISIIVVFTLMPGLLMSFSKLIDKTHHKSFVPKITLWCNSVVKARFVTPIIFLVIAFGGMFLAGKCEYAYSYEKLSTIKESETQIADEMIKNTFSDSNILAVVIPSTSYENEQKLVADLEKYPQISSVTALASTEAEDGYDVGDSLTPREFSELTDMDIEKVMLLYASYAADQEEYGKIIGGIGTFRVPLIDMFKFVHKKVDEGYVKLDDEDREELDEKYEDIIDGEKQLESKKYTRIVLDLNLPEESDETFAFLKTIKKEARKYYGNKVLLVGDSTSNRDLSSTFQKDNAVIGVLTLVFVMLILLFTFQSVAIPIILIMVIQGSIWINFSFSTMMKSPVFFISYLVVSSIQMGANIDYAIVMTNRYLALRKSMKKLPAIKLAMEQSFPTVFTSGSILASAGLAIGVLSSDAVIASIGLCLGRGTIISIFLVMGILPQLLVLGDYIIERTSFSMKHKKRGEI